MSTQPKPQTSEANGRRWGARADDRANIQEGWFRVVARAMESSSEQAVTEAMPRHSSPSVSPTAVFASRRRSDASWRSHNARFHRD
jgi:hypothetical protein